MSKARRIYVLLLIFSVLIVMAGCKDTPFQHTFRQDRSQVEKVEICSFDSYQREFKETLASLTGAQIDEILIALSSTDCWRLSGLDSPRGYGDVLICIHYLDGEIEVIGQKNTGWITPSGDWNYSMDFFKANDLYTILRQYVAPKVLAEVSEYF